MEAQYGYAPAVTGRLNLPQAGINEKNPRKLDNTAIIFPSVATPDDPHVYRATSTLREDIDPELLQKSLHDVLPYFEAFTVRLTKGIFWRKFEKSHVFPAIEKDDGNLCRHFDEELDGGPPFRMLYSGSSIHIEAFHSLTDGVGALRFLMALTYRYCQLAYSHKLHPDYHHKIFGLEHSGALIDGYAHACHLPQEEITTRIEPERVCFQLRGELLDNGSRTVQIETIPVETLKVASKRHDVTLGVYLAAAIVYAIHEEFVVPKGEMLGLCLPINLRPIFKIETALNFFSNVLVQIPHDCLDSFESTLNETKRQFYIKSTKERLHRSISERVQIQNNRFVNVVPLAVKDPILKRVYQHEKKKRTATFSNLGILPVHEHFKPFLKGVHAIISTSSSEPLRFVSYSFDGELSLSCISRLKNINIMSRLSQRFQEA